MQNSRLKQISTAHLKLGMFVGDLDRPWLETPFLVQGFVIQSPDEIRILQDLCDHVYIDVGTGHLSAGEYDKPTPGKLKPAPKTERSSIADDMGSVKLSKYQDQNPFLKEMNTVESIYRDYEKTVGRFYDDIRIHQKVNIAQVQQVVGGIVASIMRNPDACLLLNQLRKKDDYAYNHAIGTSIWATSLGRQLGLPKEELEKLALGALLSDVGKVEISSRVLHKSGKLSEMEFNIVKTHVESSVRLLRESRNVDPEIISMVQSHHERHDGSGYPHGQSAHDIPVYARIIGLVDTYDAMTSNRPHARPLPPSDAIRKIYNMRNVDFQAEIVEEFIQAIGLYPPGTLVELTTDEVAIVVSETRRRRLRPRVLILLDKNKNPVAQQRYINLHEELEDSEGRPIEILRSLEQDAYGVDLSNIVF